MRVWLLAVLLAGCAAVHQDLTGQMFTFPEESTQSVVSVNPSKQTFSAITVCLRFFTDLRRDHVLFSMASTSNANAFLIYATPSSNEIQLYVQDKNVAMYGLDVPVNEWHSLCATWDSASGLGQMWLNGHPSVRKYVASGSSISARVSIILGQEQDTIGGGFIANECFVGMMADVHMWDHILGGQEIYYYMDKLNFSPGNVLSWRSLEFEYRGRLQVERK